jgi:Mlc titration factor MtfA (ptsG expression regulator)
VVFHEFAHQLDQADGAADGAPELDRPSMYGPWARVLGHDYDQLQTAADRNKKTVMDKYGAESPAEFFAVVTEAFFEKPLQLEAKHPELYEQMRSYYRQDPAASRRAR